MDFTLIKKPFLWAAAAAAMLLPAHLAAQVKVGVVNFQQALLATAEMQKEAGKLEQKFAPRQDQIEKLSNELDEIQKKMQSANEEEAQRLQDEIGIQTEAVGAAMDALLAEASNQLTLALNLLTVLGICLALMGAVFGAWGMNFEVIPISKHRWGFWLVVIMLAVTCTALLVGTKRMGVW